MSVAFGGGDAAPGFGPNGRLDEPGTASGRPARARRGRLLGHPRALAEYIREGIEKAILLRPDATVLDLAMPDLDGFETVPVLRGHERTRQIPVLALTGAMLDRDERAREEGFSTFLRKPCLPQYLLHELRRVLRP